VSVFRDFREAWRQAVENFWHELEAEDPEGRGVYRQVARARNHLDALDSAIDETRQRVAEEKEQVDVCLRRERMARRIGDTETAEVAAEYRARHQERAEVLARKLEALEAERRLCARELDEMERALQEGRVAAAQPELEDLNRHPHEDDFRTLEETEATRSAEERLEELKRRMKQE
jgi:hypothetical protein